LKVSTLKTNPGNPRQIKGEKLDKLKASVGGFQKMMELRPMVVDENNVVLGGNMRLAAIKALGLKEIPDEWVKFAKDLTEDEKAQFIITDNSSFGEYDWDVIANSWTDYPLADWGLDVPDFEAVDEQETQDSPTLADRFLMPPFSVLDARQGYWQDRKRAWLALGIQSELGRGG
jgi:ParB-like chromosome segregation protein Spo0J